MSNKTFLTYLHIGFISCWILVLLQIGEQLHESLRIDFYYSWIALRVLNSFFSLLVLFLLWRLLVKHYEQQQLAFIFSVMLPTASILVLFSYFSPERLVESIFWIGFVLAGLIYLVFYFLFSFKVMYIDDMAIPAIEKLKNFNLAFIICIFFLLLHFAISGYYRFTRLDFFLKTLLVIVPWIFLSVFFRDTKRSMLHQ